MKFYNIFRYDFRYGFLSRPGKWAAVVFYGVFLFISFSFSLFHGFYGEVDSLWDINSLSLSMGDVFMADLGGKLPPDFQQLQSYSFPTTWFVWQILPCVLTLSYMSEDLSQGGMQVMIRARKKSWWWFSKCLWNLWVVLVYYGLGYLTLWLLSFASGKAQTWELNPRIFQFQFAQSLPASHSTSLFVSVCLLPCLVGMAVNLMQMTLTLFVKPIFAFVAACCYWHHRNLLRPPSHAFQLCHAGTQRGHWDIQLSTHLGCVPLYLGLGGLLPCGEHGKYADKTLWA